MTNDWIAFLHYGETRLDVVLCYRKDAGFPYSDYAITARNGKVSRSSIIETRAAVAAAEADASHGARATQEAHDER